MAGSIYQVIRRRIAPLAIVLAFGLLIFNTCGKRQRIEARIVLELGASSEVVSRLEVDVVVGDDVVSTFSRDRAAAGVMGTPAFDAVLPGPDATLHVRIHVPGRIITARKTIVAEDGAVITVPLASHLAPR